MNKNQSFNKYINILFIIMGLLYMATFISCDKSDDNDPPEIVSELGDTLWIHDRISGDYYMGESLALGKDGSIYYSFGGNQVTGEEVRIAAVDKTDGSLLWMTEDMDHIGLSSHIMVGDDGTVYAIGYYTLYAIDPGTGTFKWTWEVPENLPLPDGGVIFSYGQIGSMALLGNGNVILGSVSSGVYSRALYCINNAGNMLWFNRDAVNWGLNGLTVGADNKIFYYEDYHLKSVDGVSGQLLWTKKIGATGTAANNIAINDNGELICSFIKEGDTKYYLYRLDPGNGTILWESVDESSSSGLLLSPNGQATQLLGNLHLIDLTSGTARKFTEENVGLATVINSSNQFLIPDIEDYVTGCSTYEEDGTLVWHMKMGNMKGQIVIDNNNVIYGIRMDGKIFAVQGDSKLANTGWPKIGHDNRNTFNYNKQ